MQWIKKWWKTIVVLEMAVLMLFLFYFYRVKTVANQESASRVVSASEEQIQDCESFDGKTVMEQTIFPEKNHISSFNLMFRNPENSTLSSNVKVEFLDEKTGTVVKTWEIASKDIHEYEYKYFAFDEPVRNTSGNPFIIRVISDDLGKIAPAVTNYDAYEGGVKIGSSESENIDMVYALQASNRFLKVLYVIFSCIVLVGVLGVAILLVIKNRRLENYFLVLGLTWGCLFVILFPPNTAPDEHAHIASAYADANKLLLRDATDENGNVLVRQSDAEIANINKVSLESWAYYFDKMTIEPSDTIVSYDRGAIQGEPFVAHLPQAIGVAVGWLLNINSVATLFLGKMFGLIFYLICGYFAIKLIPWGKIILLIIALFPMSLEIAGSFSYDCTVNALCFLFISYTMKLIYENKQVTWKEYALLALISAWMAPCKIAYVFVCGLAFAIPSNKTKNRKVALFGKGIVFGIGFVLVLIQRMTLMLDLVKTQTVIGGGEEISGFTLEKIISSPIHSLGMIFNTYFEQAEYYFGTLIGQSLGWFQVNISWLLICGFVVVLLLALISDNENEQCMTWRQRMLVYVLSVIMTGGIVLSMWLDFTPENINYIAGVQGRYILTFFPMIMLSLKSKLFSAQKNINSALLVSVCVLELFVTFDVWKYIVV